MVVEFSIHSDDAQWGKLVDFGKAAIDEALALTANELWRNLRIEAPVDHGRLAGSFLLEERSDGWAVVSGVEYALTVLEGSPQVEIEPNTRQALAGQTLDHPVSRVLHPGQKANDYSGRAEKITQGRIPEFIQRAIMNAESEIT